MRASPTRSAYSVQRPSPPGPWRAGRDHHRLGRGARRAHRSPDARRLVPDRAPAPRPRRCCGAPAAGGACHAAAFGRGASRPASAAARARVLRGGGGASVCGGVVAGERVGRRGGGGGGGGGAELRAWGQERRRSWWACAAPVRPGGWCIVECGAAAPAAGARAAGERLGGRRCHAARHAAHGSCMRGRAFPAAPLRQHSAARLWRHAALPPALGISPKRRQAGGSGRQSVGAG